MKKLYFGLIFTLVSCNFKTDCMAFITERKNESCSMIVDIPPKPSSVYFNVIGRNLENGKTCECEEESRWWATFSDQIQKGDTIIKKKGELVFYIHKKDTVLTFNWECEGKVYR